MKTLMISTLCAIALCSVQLGVSAKPAQADTLDRYVIDGTNVTDFDGSQLVGKTVKSYDVMTAKSGKTVYRIHTITTSPSLSDLRGKFSGMSLNLDALKELENIDFEEIKKMGSEGLEKLKEQIDGLKDELEIYRNISADVMYADSCRRQGDRFHSGPSGYSLGHSHQTWFKSRPAVRGQGQERCPGNKHQEERFS